MEFSADGLRAAGFEGFVAFSELEDHRHELATPGVYVVLRPEDREMRLTETSTGGRFKGRDPAMPLSELQAAWNLPTPVLYIGKGGALDKAGKRSGKASIWSRLSAYAKFGTGAPVSHWGGRAIWHVEDASNALLVCWKDTFSLNPRLNPKCAESLLLDDFQDVNQGGFGMKPMANLQGSGRCECDVPCRWVPANEANPG